MKLVIVESPTKAKTISKFLDRTFTVKSSYGHIRDLPKKEMGIDIKKDFAPRYIIPRAAAKKVSELRQITKKSDKIILATDEDREGEAIAWHLTHALNLKDSDTARIVFHEITKKAIDKALENPRRIDLRLVDSQQARRILDRLVGYELSPFLWKKIKRGLSAGRVQSVALRFIAEREREIEKFKGEEYWTITVKLEAGSKKQEDKQLDANLIEKNDKKIEETITLKLFAGDYKTKKTEIKSQKAADEIVDDLKGATYKVKDITRREIRRTPPPPFTTSTLQQTAINNLGFSSKQTMMIAQKLYEEGHITYMRTDSVSTSLDSMLSAKKTIDKIFGKDYSLENPRFYKTRSKGAQEAHEAVRPAYPDKTPDELKNSLDNNQFRLYRLIWNRMIASQMQPAVLDLVKIDIEANNKNKYLLAASGSTIKFPGYFKVYGDKVLASEKILPDLEKDDELGVIEVVPAQKSTTPPPRYNEASLVKTLEEYGIGRPSTYAPTISTIIDRKYIEKNEERRLQPQEIGLLVNDLLVEHFPEIVDIKFTAHMEENFDQIAEGKKEWVPVIREFYKPFHQHLEKKTKTVKKEDVLEKLDRQCPECGGDLIVKFGRFGKFIACNKFPDCRYTEKTEEEKEVEKENSGEVCDKCGAPMVVKRGKYGAFLGCSKYPECKGIKRIENKIGMKCSKCQEGDIVQRQSKKGRIFYGCNKYPKCDFALWSKPTGEKCPQCDSLLIYNFKNKITCSNKECGYVK